MKKSTWDLILERPLLTDEEKQLEFAELYDRTFMGPDAKVLYALRENNPIKPEDAIFDFKELLTTNSLPVENGYCNLPNGGGYAAVQTEFHGITVEQYNWWRKWRFDCSAENELIRYKLWCPGSHISQVHVPSEIAVEDIGLGPEEFQFLGRLSKEDLFDAETLDLAEQFDFYLSNTKVYAPYNPADGIYGVVLHVIRETEYGFEMRSRFWQGYTVENRQLVCKLKAGEQVHPDYAYLLAHHCANEMASLRELIPLAYQKHNNTNK